MGEYVIERGIPIPPHRNTDENSLSGKVRALEVGESLWANKPITTMSAAGRVCRRKYPERMFTIRQEGTGARIWRTE